MKKVLKQLLMLVLLLSIIGCSTTTVNKQHTTTYNKEYYPSGELRAEIIYYKDKTNGLAKSYYKNGGIKKLISFRNDTVLKNAKSYYDKGEMKEHLIFTNGILKEFYKNGNLKREMPFKNKKKHGEEIQYHPNGKIKISLTFVNRVVQDGTYIEYTNNGIVLNELLMKNGRVSISKWFYKSGEISSKMTFDNKGLDGKSIVEEYDRSGVLKSKTILNNGKEISSIKY